MCQKQVESVCGLTHGLAFPICVLYLRMFCSVALEFCLFFSKLPSIENGCLLGVERRHAVE